MQLTLFKFFVIGQFPAVLDAVRVDRKGDFGGIFTDRGTADTVPLIPDPERQRFRPGALGNRQIAGNRPFADTGDFHVVNETLIALLDQLLFQQFRRDGGECLQLFFPIHVEIRRIGSPLLQRFRFHPAAEAVLDIAPPVLCREAVRGQQRGLDHHETGAVQ